MNSKSDQLRAMREAEYARRLGLKIKQSYATKPSETHGVSRQKTTEVVTNRASPNKVEPSPNTASPNKSAPSPNKHAARNLRWRAKNPDQYRTYQRELMRKRRAGGQAS
jgi:hypothetical protein